ncbi:MAG: methyltransferase domain-containing protein, partial [Candidatus Omnitrophica bacterium]|nr:methyltransferase domain-containing protein [Candidatus Omnitrophota bacterium]MBD3268632.1 methyltransferase domain-containing protein [Candidatus Omnitrophota bacterium]
FMKEKKGINYDGLSAWQYYLRRGKDLASTRRKARYIFSRFASRGKGTVVEIASGPSFLSIELYKLLKGDFHFYGTDVDLRMLHIASNRADEDACRINFIKNDAAELPFKDNSFDLIVSEYSFHHFKEPVKVLKEIKRILNPRGVVFIYDFNPASLYAFMVRFVCEVRLLHAMFKSMRNIDLTPLRHSLDASYDGATVKKLLAESGFVKFALNEGFLLRDIRIEMRK